MSVPLAVPPRTAPESSTEAPEPRVLVIDDDPQARRLVCGLLRANALRVVDAATRLGGLARAKADRPEAIVVDPAACDMNGFEFIAELREESRAPILVLSESARERDKVRALEAGAEDYIVKPFGDAELVARVRVALRRRAPPPRDPADSVIVVGGLRLDHPRRLVSVDGAEVHLTPLEYRLFGMLMKQAGSVVTQRELLAELWGPHCDAQLCLRVHVSQLRHKLEKDPKRPQYLITEPGVGYRIRVPPAGASEGEPVRRTS